MASVPLIIPPVKQKSYGLYASLFDDLWKSAEDALVLAERIVIIGYSFPQTDLKSLSLFKRAFTRRSNMPRVVIVDPNPERIAETVRFEFGISDDHLTVIKDYFSEHFDLDALGL